MSKRKPKAQSPKPIARCITLLSDFGNRDVYVGVMKGVIASINPDAAVIDLCHEVTPQDVREGAYMLGASFSYFPQGTIHVALIDPGVGGSRRAIAARAAGHLFVLPDNGLISFVAAKHPLEQVVWLKNDEFFSKPVSRTFHGRDVFAPVAAHLSLGKPLDAFGPPIDDPVLLFIPKPVKREADGRTILTGEVIHVDHFGNLVTNIDESDLPGGRPRIRIKSSEIAGLKRSYSEAERGELIGLIGSFGSLEISVVHGSAAGDLRVEAGEKVEIEI